MECDTHKQNLSHTTGSDGRIDIEFCDDETTCYTEYPTKTLVLLQADAFLRCDTVLQSEQWSNGDPDELTNGQHRHPSPTVMSVDWKGTQGRLGHTFYSPKRLVSVKAQAFR